MSTNFSQSLVEFSLAERIQQQMQSVSLPMHDVNGLMRLILDSLGTLKGRLEEEATVAPHILKVFTESCKMILEHLNGFQPLDNESAVKFIVEEFPNDLKRRDGRGWLPVHWATAVHDTEPALLKSVVEEYPVALLKGHQHCPLIPEGAPLQATYRGLLPLHIASSLRYPNLENIHLLVKRAPDALSLPDQRGWLPLHWCAFNNRQAETMQFLIKAYPDACYEVNKKGKLPFQLAAYNRYTLMMELLLNENPEAIDGMDYNGNTPLHDAAKSLNYEAVKKLLAMKPDLNRVRNFKEELPIHRAFSFIAKGSTRLYHRQFETIKALLSVNPEIAALPDRNDSLPLHLAVFHHCSFEICEYVYNIYPSAALVKDNHDKLPIHYVTTAEVKALLMKASPPLIKAGIKDTFSRFASG